LCQLYKRTGSGSPYPYPYPYSYPNVSRKQSPRSYKAARLSASTAQYHRAAYELWAALPPAAPTRRIFGGAEVALLVGR